MYIYIYIYIKYNIIITTRDDNLNKVIFVHLKINSIRNKFEELISQRQC